MPATPAESDAADGFGLVQQVELFQQTGLLLHLMVNIMFGLPGHEVAEVGVLFPWITMENVWHCHQKPMSC